MLMQTHIRELPVPAVASGLAVLGGAALWQLGIEFERAWMRSYDGPLLGDTFDTPPQDRPQAPSSAYAARTTSAADGHRRWVARHHPRAVRRAAHMA
jgi:hypothetical protein